MNISKKRKIKADRRKRMLARRTDQDKDLGPTERIFDRDPYKKRNGALGWNL